MADELTTTTAAESTPATTTATATAEKQPWQDTGARVQAVKDMYGANLESQKANIQSAYDQSVSNIEQSRQQIGETYRQQQNAASAAAERNKRNAIIAANANGINTGAKSQMQLGLSNAGMAAQAQLATAQAQQQAQLDRDLGNLKNEYQTNINKAVADNNYQLAAALLDEYQNAYNNQKALADQMASFGVFSGYNGLANPEDVAAMQSTWASQNPDVAWSTGAITANQYKALTGKNPTNSTWVDANGYFTGVDPATLKAANGTNRVNLTTDVTGNVWEGNIGGENVKWISAGTDGAGWYNSAGEKKG